MNDELEAAINYLASFLQPIVDQASISRFKSRLWEILETKFRDHWHRDCPVAGNGFRCITVNKSGIDVALLKSAKHADISVKQLLTALPSVLWLWIDPFVVASKTHEHGSTCVIYENSAELDIIAHNLPPVYFTSLRPLMSKASSITSSSSNEPMFVESDLLAHPQLQKMTYIANEILSASAGTSSRANGFYQVANQTPYFTPPKRRPVTIVAPSSVSSSAAISNSNSAAVLSKPNSPTDVSYYKPGLYYGAPNELSITSLDQRQNKSQTAMS